MKALIIIALTLILLFFLATLVCFLLVFYSPKRKTLKEDEYEIPKGEIYEEFREDIVGWTKDIRQMPHEEIRIKSFDGLTLVGYYYEYEAGAPTELLFHGYRGFAERDLCGGVHRCFALKRNALIIDMRASGKSDGHVITFGIKEGRDVLSWVDYATARFGKNVPLILTGISMGASTVLIASGEELPENVVCVLADCGYTSAKEIIIKVMGDLKLPVWLFYPLVRIGALIYAGLDIEKNSPIEAVKRSKIAHIFIHGDNDAFVPMEMSKVLFEASVCENKSLHIIEGAGHGLAFPKDKEGYIKALSDFEKSTGFLNTIKK